MEKKTNKEIDWDERWFEVFKAAITGILASHAQAMTMPDAMAERAIDVANNAIERIIKLKDNNLNGA